MAEPLSSGPDDTADTDEHDDDDEGAERGDPGPAARLVTGLP
jgi:hypothetical protein